MPQKISWGALGRMLGIGSPDEEVELATDAPVLTEGATGVGPVGQVGAAPTGSIEGRTPSAPTDPQLAADLAAERTQRQELERLLREERADRARAELKTQADTFLSTMLREERILPAAVAGLTTAYVAALEDDRDRPIEGHSRVAALEAAYRDRPPHRLTAERISPEAPSGSIELKNDAVPDPSAPITPERRKKLLSYTESGQLILQQEAARTQGNGRA